MPQEENNIIILCQQAVIVLILPPAMHYGCVWPQKITCTAGIINPTARTLGTEVPRGVIKQADFLVR